MSAGTKRGSSLLMSVFAGPCRVHLLACVLLASSSSSTSRAQVPSLVAADEALKNGDPDAALSTLQQPTSSLSLADFIEHRRLLATARAFVGDVDGAVLAFGELLASSPAFSMPYTASPKVTVAFEKARAARRLPIVVELLPPALARPDEPIAVTLTRSSDPGGAIAIVVLDSDDPADRLDVVSTSQPAPPLAGASTTFAVAAPPITDTSAKDDAGRPGVLLRLRARGLDVDGNERFVGDWRTVPVGFAAAAPITDNPWLWVGVGAGVLVVGGVAAAVAVALASAPDTVPVDIAVRR